MRRRSRWRNNWSNQHLWLNYAHGVVALRSRSDAPQVLEASLRGSHAPTLVQRFGDWPVGLALAIVVGSSLHALIVRPWRNHA